PLIVRGHGDWQNHVLAQSQGDKDSLAVSPQLIERREFKYLISPLVAARVREAIKPFCILDPFAARQPTGNYTIRSLYLDTPDFALHRANEQEIRNRFKLRVRSYPGVEGSAVYFEVKRRFLDVIVKERGQAPSDWGAILEGEPGADELKTPACHSFVSLVRSHGCRPTVMVEYEREPHVSTIDDYARVTFDSGIRCQPALGTTLNVEEERWRNVDGREDFHDSRDLLVLELKFTERVPTWLVNIVRRLELDRRAFSKYGRSIEAWSQTPLIERVSRFGRRGA
ncbi:MAG: polyphosphate polymerase domain-containing protein, partial [Myxococcota bacterium]|nr:polyphosphate polymerase domain-containing protein [Myxococcota bacterium]